MSDSQQSLSAQSTRNVLQQVFGEIRLARATELAQSERFAEAEAVLREGGYEPESAGELDLLARMAALQGNFDKARGLWNRALQLDPQNSNFQSCLRSLTPGRQAERMIAVNESKLWNLFAVVVVTLVIVTLIFLLRK